MEPKKTPETLYRTMSGVAGLQHWNPLTIEISRAYGWKLGPFAGGHIQWGDKMYHVLSCRWFTLMW